METVKDFLTPELIWFLIGLALLILEFVMPGLIIAFFGIGAWVVVLVCLLSSSVSGSINAQLMIFIFSSLLLLLGLRKWLKTIFAGHISKKQDMSENLEDFAGKRVTVIKKITPEMPGKVELHGVNWEAAAGEEIAEGTVVEVIGKNNITLNVKRL